MSDDLADILRILLERLASAGVPYLVVGSVAALAHGRSRATEDLRDTWARAGLDSP